ncbi:HEPN domain-containing protein [Streptomyces sp. NPDC056202]|uniref:ApeA N-terminal domain 1-containing protein n=1 Tax=Streptomyces sp. NPDC056202 TaxID=3345745 RepID=UPI0035E00F56
MLSGSWWTPEDPEARVPGSLVCVDGRWRLDLIGTLMVNAGGGGLRLAPSQTIYGACRGHRYSLQGGHLYDSETPTWGEEQGGDQSGMTWIATTLIREGHFQESHIFNEASLRMTGLSSWWPSSGLVGRRASKYIEEYERPDALSIETEDGFSIRVGVAETGRRGRRIRSLEESIRVWITKESGFTIEDLDLVVNPMRALVAIANDAPVEVFDLRLTGPSSRFPFEVRVDPGVGELKDDDFFEGLFNADAFDMQTFIPAWISLAQSNVVPMDVAEPRKPEGTLQNRLVHAVAAAETLHRGLHPEPASTPESELAVRVAAAMGASESFKVAEINKVRKQLSYTSISLEKRLVQLANGLGVEVVTWLFGDQVKDWAFAVQSVRNLLSHGFAADHDVENDTGVLYVALRLAEAILRLSLVVAAGGPKGDDLLSLLRRDVGYRALAAQEMVDWVEVRKRISSK